MNVRRYTIAAAVFILAGGFTVMSGCAPEDPVLPPVLGADGFVDSGWVEYQAGNFSLARELFASAIEVDATYAEAYLGAGMSSLHLADYWSWASGYFYMAAQQAAGGNAPFFIQSENQVQDSAGTVFEMLSDSVPVLPRQYRFQALNDGLLSIHLIDVVEHTAVTTGVDSIVRSGSDTWVYVTVAPFEFDTPDTTYDIWIDPGFTVTYEYTNTPLSGLAQIGLDAMVGYSILENSRQSAGDMVLGSGLAWGAGLFDGSYEFGEGENYDTVEEIDIVDVHCLAAQHAFSDQAFMIAWEIVKEAGYGESLDPTRPEFVYELMLVIESMQD